MSNPAYRRSSRIGTGYNYDDKGLLYSEGIDERILPSLITWKDYKRIRSFNPDKVPQFLRKCIKCVKPFISNTHHVCYWCRNK